MVFRRHGRGVAAYLVVSHKLEYLINSARQRRDGSKAGRPPGNHLGETAFGVGESSSRVIYAFVKRELEGSGTV